MKKKRDRKACTIHVRVPCALKKQLKFEAKYGKVSLSALVVKICHEWIIGPVNP